MFNDQMESVAIAGCGLGEVPVNALKGHTGHTLGAAGILETVLTAAALERGFILPTKGYCERGVSGRINIVREPQKTDGRRFLKMISGFGGGNAALSLVLTEAKEAVAATKAPEYVRTHSVKITPDTVQADGRDVACEGEGLSRLTALYKQYIASYPKYYKMDPLARLGFVASELLLQAEGKERVEEDRTRGVVLFNRSSSIMADRAYEATVGAGDNYYPSPSAFIYTLPNIVTGEIALRNGYRGETAFCLMARKDEALMARIIGATLTDRRLGSLIAGWIDCEDELHYEAELYTIESIK
jgi:3-oxoacyl-[acyl-carrier-protein] synthase-1